MFIRYHLIYYAIGSLFWVLGFYYHFVFFVFWIVYLLWLYQRLTYQHVLICLGCCLLIAFFPRYQCKQTSMIEGTVKKVSEHYCYVQTQIGMMKLYHDHDLKFKDEIVGKVEYLDMNENTNDHAFNERLYLYGQNIFLKAKLVQLESIQHHHSFYHFVETRLSDQTEIQSYQRLFLLGERDDNISEDYQQLSNLSLVHLFALSGMHVNILNHCLLAALGLIMDKKYAKWISYGFIGLYIFSIPMQISLYRAYFMMVIYEVVKTKWNQLDVLSFLIIISFLYNPYYIYNASFVFSYFIFFIVLITKHLSSSYIWIYLSTIPLLLNINYQIPLLSFLLSSFLLPFIEFFYILCCLSIVLPNDFLLLEITWTIFQKILQLLTSFNVLFSFSKPTLAFVCLYYIIYFSILYRLLQRKKVITHITMIIALLISFGFYGKYKIYGEITMIDVGQGDCTFIRLPFDQGNILIDTGGNQNFDLATQTIIPYLHSIGVHHLDYVYISHSDYDHSGALDSLKEHFPIDHIIDEFETYRKIGDLQITMLEHTSSFDTNDQSLVMDVQYQDYHILFTGDISASVEKELARKYTNLDVDILKVSHHGSQSASSVDLFEWIHPQIAMIGVKKNNIYHHPSQSVIERLNRKKIMILRTDEDGMFHIRFYPHMKYIVFR